MISTIGLTHEDLFMNAGPNLLDRTRGTSGTGIAPLAAWLQNWSSHDWQRAALTLPPHGKDWLRQGEWCWWPRMSASAT